MSSNFGDPVYYGKPFFFRRTTSEILSESYEGSSKDMGYWKVRSNCAIQGGLHSTSLMAFHGPKASRRYESEAGPFHASSSVVEVKHTQGKPPLSNDRRAVTFSDRVTIYGNVGDDGLYLSPAIPSLLWKKSKNDIMREPIGESEWTLCRVDGKVTGEICYGDIVCIESILHPGYYVSTGVADNSHEAALRLSCIQKDYFILLCPSLRELVTLEAARKTGVNRKENVSRAVNISDMESLRDKDESDKIMQRLALLPVDLVYEILKSERCWKSLFRLVCKEWRDIAEREVVAIKLNNSFVSEGGRLFRARSNAFVERCFNVQRLFLRNLDDLTVDDAWQLLSNKQLTKLHLGGCRTLTDDVLLAVTSIQTLQHLNIACSKVTDEGLDLISKCLVCLTSLDLYGCQSISISGVSSLLELPHLQALNLRGTQVTIDAVRTLRSKNNLLTRVQILTGPLLMDDIY